MHIMVNQRWAGNLPEPVSSQRMSESRISEPAVRFVSPFYFSMTCGPTCPY